MICAYQPCDERAIHQDHVMPWARRRKEHDFHDTVPACFYHLRKKRVWPRSHVMALAQLAAEQHEFISAHWKIMHKRCEHGSCKSLRMAAAFKEKYE